MHAKGALPFLGHAFGRGCAPYAVLLMDRLDIVCPELRCGCCKEVLLLDGIGLGLDYTMKLLEVVHSMVPWVQTSKLGVRGSQTLVLDLCAC